MLLDIFITLTAILVLLLLFTWLIKVFQLTIKTVLVIVAILILLQVVLGIDSQNIIQEMEVIVGRIRQFLSSQL